MAPTCFGLRPSSGSLQLSLAEAMLILKHSVRLRRNLLCGGVAACPSMACVVCAVQSETEHTALTFSQFHLNRGTDRQQCRCIVPKAVYTVKKSTWGWANLSPETCRAELKRLINEKGVASRWLLTSLYWWCSVTQTSWTIPFRKTRKKNRLLKTKHCTRRGGNYVEGDRAA